MHIANIPNREAAVGLSTPSRASSGDCTQREKVGKRGVARIDLSMSVTSDF
jgi:hypothetical protein